jgi:hypothetical protein
MKKTREFFRLPKLPTKLRCLSLLSVVFALIFTFFLLSPLDLYLHNTKDYQIGFRAEFLPLLLFSLTAFCVLSVILLMPWFGEKVQNGIILLLSGLLIAAYVQMLFLNGEMVSVTGDDAKYSEYTMPHIINFAVFLIITVLPLCIEKGFEDKKKTFAFDKPVIFAAFLIVGMQAAGLVSAAASVSLPQGYEEIPEHLSKSKYMSYTPVFEIGNTKNVTVFLFDRFDTHYAEDVFRANPELSTELDGFTFYKNNTAEYTNTFPSVTTMLTGNYYESGETWEEYWKESWSKRSFLDVLSENGYEINLLIDANTTYGDFSEIENRADNVKENDHFKLNYKQIILTNIRLSALRLSPYFIKGIAAFDLFSGFSNDFFIFDYTDGQAPVVSIDTDMSFYRFLSENKIKVGDNEKTFSFIHLNCAHDGGYHFDEKTGKIVQVGDHLDSTRACFEMLNIYINGLKSIGEYDNTAIVVIGDHGRPANDAPAHGTGAERVQLQDVITTGLLIKPAGFRGVLLTDDKAQLSNKYFGAGILELAGIPHNEFGYSYFDIAALENPPKRHFYHYVFEQIGEMSPGGYYEIGKNANDFNDWEYFSQITD